MTLYRFPKSSIINFFVAFFFCGLTLSAAIESFDVVVYGGTAGGVATAVAAAREGVRVALLEPGRHLGGMVSGGLGWTDYGKKEVIGGLALEFFERVGRYYKEPVTWHFEPHVAERVFNDLVEESGVHVFLGTRLRETGGVQRRGTAVREIVMENGVVFRAKIFADCTYEGDLMAQAKVTFTWGRESSAQYGESLAGVRGHTPYHQFTVKISPFDIQGKPLPEVNPGPKGEAGSADRKVQAYNFRLCLTNAEANRVALERPRNYDPARYELLARMLEAIVERDGRAPALNRLMTLDKLPNAKTDVNNNGGFSTDYIGKSWEYPNASYARRQQIWQDHKDYIAGFLYFLANEPRVPASLRREMNEWGLARDEFTDSANWPRQLYIREARRMVGPFVMTQKDIQTDLVKEDAIGMGSYNSDSHNVQRVATAEGAVENEGDMQVPVTPYQIPYRVLLPDRREATNLLVPVCFSASHVAYSTVRMEPQYMILGEAAGRAAKMAINAKCAVQDVNTKALTAKLVSNHVPMKYVKTK